MIPLHLESLGPITDASTGATWSSEQLREETMRRAAALAARGVGHRSRVLLLHGNSPGFFADLFATWLNGATAACADPGLGPADLTAMTSELHPQVLIAVGGVPERLASVTADIEVVESGAHADPTTWRPPTDVRPDDPALVLFTSGSTGLPKGVVHSFRTLSSKWAGLRHHVPLERCRTTLCALPTHFGHGLICNALYPLVHGCHLIIMPKLDLRGAGQLGDILATHHVTFMSSVPAMWRLILQLDPGPGDRTLEQVHIGSAPLSAELWRAVQEWSGTRRVWNTYGITETGSWVAGPVDEPEPEPLDGLIGRGWNSRILVAPTDVEPSALAARWPASVPAGETGQVLLHTADLMQGYLERPEETAQAVHGLWLRTGDLGYLDERGRLVLVGRERNEINKGGIKISPEEVDLALERHPGIAEACTFRVTDELLGEDLEVAVRQAPGTTLTPAEVTRWVQGQLAASKVPRAVHLVEEIPKTSRGKVNREQVAAAVTGA